MSALKNKLSSLERGTTAAHKFANNFDLVFCICFKAGEQKMRPCAFLILYADLLRGSDGQLRAKK